jgi:hypothetical protein
MKLLKYLPPVAGVLLGLLFVMSAVVVLFNLVSVPPPTEGSAEAHFAAAFGPTGYLTFIKALELTGGILVAIPKTRNLGLLVLGPIIVNILAYHAFVAQAGLFSPAVLMVVVPAAYLLWDGRKQFAALIR